MKKYLITLLIALFIIPSIALASWWNPLSWFNGWIFNKKSIEIQVNQNKITPTLPVQEEKPVNTIIKKESAQKNIKISTSQTNTCTSSKGKVMTYKRALEIAKNSSCASVGKFSGEFGCNDNSGGLIDVYMNPVNHPGCGFACRISIDSEKSEEGWMCTGLIPSTEEELKDIPSVESINMDDVPNLR